MLENEIGEAIEINSFSWKRAPGGDPQGTFYNMKIYMGLCSNDELSLAFDDNYITGTRILVMSASSYTTQTVGVDEWFEFDLDTPFFYNGQENLVVEVEWSSGGGSLYSWAWNGGTNRRIYGEYGTPTALVQDSDVPNLRLNGSLSLSNSTFAQIKASFN